MDEQNTQHDVGFSNLGVRSQVDTMVPGRHIDNISVVQSHHMMALPNGQQVILPAINSSLEGVSIQNSNTINDYSGSIHPSSVQGLILGYNSQPVIDDDNQHISDDEHEIVIDSQQMIQQIQDEGRRKAQNTLVGRLADYMRQMNRPVSLEECINAIGDSFRDLRKADGTKYKGDHFKAINGALFSTGVFKKTDDNRWTLKGDEIDAYEERMQKKFEEKCRRRKNMIDDDLSLPMSHKKRRYTLRRNKRENIIRMVQGILEGYKQNQHANPNYFKNPFKGLNGDEDPTRLRKRLGDDKYEFMIQLFGYFEDRLTYPDSSMSSFSMMEGNFSGTKNELLFMNKEMEEMKKQISELKDRINMLEKYNSMQTNLI